MKTTTLTHLTILICLGFLTACSDGGGSASDTMAPTATNTPSVVLIENNSVITITFSESMDVTAGTWQLSGDLASESDGGVWSMTTEQNDTLTINPAGGGSWFASPGRSLTVNAQDLAGNPVAAINLNYDIYRGMLYYVDSGMPDDNGNGLNPVTARRFIHTTVADATPPATVLVKMGDYRLSNALGSHVVLKEAVSLYGGYNADFTERNPATHITTIEDRSTSGGAPRSPRSAIAGDGCSIPITTATVIDGFTILGSTQGAVSTAAILLSCSGNPTVQNNTIHGGGGSNSTGILINDSITAIRNNTIYGGSATNESYGIYAVNILGANQPTIQNNTIHGGDGVNGSYGLINEDASPGIDNNIVLTRSGTGSFCFYEQTPAGTTSTPLSLRNNNSVICEMMYRDHEGSCATNGDGDNDATTCTLSEMNALMDITGGVSSNISVDPIFIDIDGADNDINTMDDNNWRIGIVSPASVTAGGLNGRDQAPAWTYTTDKNNVIRPESGQPWSIGAFEQISELGNHALVAGQACASAGCHDGSNPVIFKSPTHPVTTNLCEACHSTDVWSPVFIPFDHSQTTDTCENCHNSSIATGKHAMHTPTTQACEICHVTSSWLTII